jgi:hypothetical protein
MYRRSSTLQAATKTVSVQAEKTGAHHLLAPQAPLARLSLEGRPCLDVEGGPIRHLDVVDMILHLCLVWWALFTPDFAQGRQGPPVSGRGAGRGAGAGARGGRDDYSRSRSPAPRRGGRRSGVNRSRSRSRAEVRVLVQGGGGGTIE